MGKASRHFQRADSKASKIRLLANNGYNIEEILTILRDDGTPTTIEYVYTCLRGAVVQNADSRLRVLEARLDALEQALFAKPMPDLKAEIRRLRAGASRQRWRAARRAVGLPPS